MAGLPHSCTLFRGFVLLCISSAMIAYGVNYYYKPLYSESRDHINIPVKGDKIRYLHQGRMTGHQFTPLQKLTRTLAVRARGKVHSSNNVNKTSLGLSNPTQRAITTSVAATPTGNSNGSPLIRATPTAIFTRSSTTIKHTTDSVNENKFSERNQQEYKPSSEELQTTHSVADDATPTPPFGRIESSTLSFRELISDQEKTVHKKGKASSTKNQQICKITSSSPHDKSVMKYIKTGMHLNCRFEGGEVTQLTNKGLILHGNALRRLVGENETACHYMGVVRRFDKKRIFSEKRLLVANIYTKSNHEFIRVDCYTLTDRKLVYSNVHSQIVDKQVVEDKLKASLSQENKTKLSVLMVGFDAMSRANTIRQMPKTYDYLIRKMGAISLNGYNAVGENTYPNLVALLTGRNESEVPKISNRVPEIFPFIWKKFSKQNYVTMYTEDQFYATFNYLTNGFSKVPTDYYQRPLWEELDSVREHRKENKLDKFAEHCFGGRGMHEIMFDWVSSFAKKFRKNPYFVFAFLNNLSHYHLNDIQTTDDYFRNFVKELFENGYLRNTLVIFHGDHGNRYDAIRSTPIGRVEHSMPLMLISLPQTVLQKFPNVKYAINQNVDILTTPYDIHSTLLDVLEGNFSVRKYSADARGLSIFGNIPEERNCVSAGVPKKYCMCDELNEIDVNSKMALRAATVALSSIGTTLEDFEDDCQPLKLNRIISAFERKKYNEPVSVNGTEVTVNLVVFETIPGYAMFEANVKLSSDVETPDWEDESLVIGTIDRINKYGDQSECMNDKHLRNYCYCKNVHEKQ